MDESQHCGCQVLEEGVFNSQRMTGGIVQHWMMELFVFNVHVVLVVDVWI
jgi:hypothetical protein